MTNTVPGPPPPFDPELGAALTVLHERMPASFTAEMIPLLRQGSPDQPLLTDEELSLDGAFTVEERFVPGPAGDPDVKLIVCLPTGATTPVGVVYYIHGGGMIIGNPRGGGALEVLEWGRELELAVVLASYRLAPENPHPAPVEDCYAGLVWTVKNAAELGIDPERVVVGGASAGGGLAAGVTLMCRDRGGPTLAAQLLQYPMLDDRNNSLSARQMTGLGVWDSGSNELGWTSLLGDKRGGPDVSPYAAPARETDLSGLPPAFIDVGSAETFRDECVDYAARIWAAGGRAELHVWPGAFHGFDGLAPQTTLSHEARALRVPWLRRVLGA